MTDHGALRDTDIAAVGAVIGDASRAAMLDALMGGQALTASELGRAAGIGRSATSEHLARLVSSGLVEVTVQGRHRYHRLAGPAVGQALEALSHIAPAKPIGSLRDGARARSLWFARTCYDHLAGACGVALHDLLIDRDVLRTASGKTPADKYAVTRSGERWFTALGIDLDKITQQRRGLVRPCLDWTERRPHLAGALAAATTDRLLALGWFVRRTPEGRALRLTAEGSTALNGLWADLEER